MRETVERGAGWGGFGMGGFALMWLFMGGPDEDLQEVRAAIRQMSEDIAEMKDEIRAEHALLRAICANTAPSEAARAVCLSN